MFLNIFEFNPSLGFPKSLLIWMAKRKQKCARFKKKISEFQLACIFISDEMKIYESDKKKTIWDLFSDVIETEMDYAKKF